MSYRTLIEINHDFGPQEDSIEFLTVLARYLRSANRDNAEALERFGVRVLGMRHHSGNFILDGEPDGFPVQYLASPKDGTPGAQLGPGKDHSKATLPNPTAPGKEM